MLRRTFLALLGLGSVMGDDNPAWHRQSQNAAQTASQEGSLDFGLGNLAPSANSGDNEVIYTNTEGSPVLLEIVSAGIDDPFTNDLFYQVQVRNGNGVAQATFNANPVNMPLIYDPAVRLQDGWDVFFTVSNETSSTLNIIADATIRIL